MRRDSFPIIGALVIIGIVCIFVFLLVSASDDVTKSLPAGATVEGTDFKRVVIDGKDCLLYEDGVGTSKVVAFDCDWSSK